MPVRLTLLVVLAACGAAAGGDHLRELQTAAVTTGASPVAHWGLDSAKYATWSSHTNRLIPVYTFGTRGAGPGVDLDSYTGAHSPYRDPHALRRIYGRVPEATLSADAEYLDQTNVADLQFAGWAAGKKHVILVVFDGMDWPTTQAAAIYYSRKIYTEGRGSGLHFQDYTAGGTTQYGYMVTSPHNHGTDVNVDTQTVVNPGGKIFGGYDPARGGAAPWLPADSLGYLISLPRDAPVVHAYTDSSSSALSMTTGAKSYNNAINVGPTGDRLGTIAHQVQRDGGAIGVVTSVPISHATPACAYAHNVDRDDFQDISRDLLGLPSIAHPAEPLPGMDVVIGGGHGTIRLTDTADPLTVTAAAKNPQGANFESGNMWLADSDLWASDLGHGGRYLTALRMKGRSGKTELQSAADRAAREGRRLLGFYGVGQYQGHLPFATADGDFAPAPGKSLKAETYTPADLAENPTLADMTQAALTVLEKNPRGFWLMVEAGDVDWANHDNNLDNSIGAVRSGDAAVKVVTDWVEQHSNWQETLLIVTADHGHYLILDKPEQLIPPQ